MRWLAALAGIAGAFHILVAAERLHLRADLAWLLISSVAFGHLGDRKGNVFLIILSLALPPPACACRHDVAAMRK